MLWAKNSMTNTTPPKVHCFLLHCDPMAALGHWPRAKQHATARTKMKESFIFLITQSLPSQMFYFYLPSQHWKLNRRESPHSQENHWVCTGYEQKVSVLVRRGSPALTGRRLLASGFYSSSLYLLQDLFLTSDKPRPDSYSEFRINVFTQEV